MDTIDGHAHFFNLKYLPVAGIIVRYLPKIIKGKNTLPTIIKIAEGAARFLIKHTESDFDIPSEKDFDELDKPLFKILEIKNFIPIHHQIIQEPELLKTMDSIQMIESLGNSISMNDLVEKEINEAIQIFQSQILEVDPTNIFPEFTKFESESQNIELVITGSEIIKKMLNWIFDHWQSDGIVKNNIGWFIFMMNKESIIAKRLIEVDEIGIKGFINLTMDVDSYFKYMTDGSDQVSHFNFKHEPLKNMHALKLKLQESKIQLYNFVAFDPIRQDSINPPQKSSLEIIKEAISKYEFVGVKFYPPMGYKPSYSEPMSETERLIEKNNNALFEYCSTKKIPIFVHCNNGGFEAYPKNSGVNSNPKYWIQILDKYKDLRINFGHAGGEYGWLSQIRKEDKYNPEDISENETEDDIYIQGEHWNKSYAAIVYKLCMTYDNVYCDFSYMDNLLTNEGTLDKIYSERLKQRLLKIFDKHSIFKDKVFYGSDWHMLFREGKNGFYFKAYQKFFNKDEFDDKLRNKFFQKNVLNYMNVGEIQPSIQT